MRRKLGRSQVLLPFFLFIKFVIMAQLYTMEIYEIERLLQTLTDRVAILHVYINLFEDTALSMHQHVSLSFQINYNIYNGVMLESV